MIDTRRRSLVTALPLMLFPRFLLAALPPPTRCPVNMLSGWVDDDGVSWLTLLNTAGIVQRWAMGFEPHQILQLPHAVDGVLAIARKPGEYALHQPQQEELTASIIEAPSGMYLYGHGAVDLAHGRLLLSGQDAVDESGRVLAYDLQNFSYIGAYQTNGIEPHQLLRSRQGQWWLAHGGMQLQPEYWRRHAKTVLNSGISIAGTNLEFRQIISMSCKELSLRHLAELPDGRMAIAGKTPHPAMHGLMFIIDHRASRPLPLAGSVRYALSVHTDGDWLAATFPLDDCIMLWKIAQGFQVQRVDLEEPSGIILHNNDCFVTSRAGFFIKLICDGKRWKVTSKADLGGRFTDHLLLISN